MRFTQLLRFKKPIKYVPNQKPASLWQDPVFGYFETHGKMEFKPGEEYDLTEDQKKIVMERYLKKEKLKREFLVLEYHPQHFNYVEGVVMDPALFRWYATDMSHIERFRITPRTVISMFAVFGLIMYGYQRWVNRPRQSHEDRCRKGEVLWWDRAARLDTEGGCGGCDTGQI